MMNGGEKKDYASAHTRLIRCREGVRKREKEEIIGRGKRTYLTDRIKKKKIEIKKIKNDDEK